MAVVCEGETDEPRRPSKRPIDHRWDASRGLVFSQPRRAALNDRTWSPHNGIKFSGNDARRYYPTKPIGGPPPKTPTQGQPTAKPIYGTNTMASLERSTSPPSQAPKGSKQQQMEMEIQTRNSRIKDLESESAAWEKLYRNSQEEIKDLQHRTKEEKERIYKKGRDDEAAAKNQTISSIEKSLREIQARRDEAREEIRSLQRQLDQERTEYASSVESLEERLRDEKLRYANERRDREDKHAKELQQAKDSFLERKEQRRDYETYRHIFDTVHSERVVLKNAIMKTIAQLGEALQKAKKLAKALQDFCAAQPGTASFGKELNEMANGRRDALEEQMNDIKAARSEMSDADTALKKAAHESRALSQTVRFQTEKDPATALGAAFRALIEQPFSSFVDRIERDESELRKQIKKATSETVREELEDSLKKRTQQKFPLLSIRSLAMSERLVQSLEVWKESPYITKAVYTGSERFKRARDTINSSWYNEIDRNRDDKVLTASGLRVTEEFGQKTRDLASILVDLDTEIRKGAHLRELLGRTSEDSQKIDAILDDRLYDARQNLEGLYRQLFGEISAIRGASKRSRVSSRSSVRPRSSVVVASKPTVLAAGSGLANQVGALKTRLADSSAFATAEGRLDAQAELDRLISQRTQENIANVVANRAATNNTAKKKRYDRELHALNAKLASGTTVVQEAGRSAIPPRATVPTSSLFIRRSRVRAMKVRTSGTSSSRRASTSAKPADFFLGGKRHMHDADLQVAQAALYDADQAAFSNQAELPTSLAGTSKTSSNFSKALGEPQRLVNADNQSLDMDGEWSAAESDSSGKHPSSDIHQEKYETDSAITGSEHSTSDSNQGETSTDTIVETPEDPPLRFQIPQADFRNAVMASSSSSAAYWKYNMYKDSDGKAPARHYCTNYEQTEAQAAKFLNEKVIGFDIEWEIGAHPGKSSTKRCVSLIQIAAEDKVGLFHVSLFKGNTPAELVPPSLRGLMESTDIIKTGVNIGGDARRIEQCLDVKMQGLFELSHLYKVVTFSENQPQKVNKVNFNLAAQVQNVLHLPLAKGEVRTSAWSKRLDNQQIEYAASDAYAGLRIFDALERKRKLMTPMPPRPSFYELKEPLVLGNGHVVVPKSRIAKQSENMVAKPAEDEEDGDEYFDAVEEQEEVDQSLDDDSAMPSADLSQFAYPDLPQLENQTLSKKPAATDQVSVGVQHPPSESMNFTSPGKAEADQWATTFRAKLDAEGRKTAAKQSALRAYYLWYHQGCDLKRTAALLKEPPLSHSTVVSYILEAVTKADLGYEVERMREVIDGVPESVKWRYASISKRVEKD